MKNSLPATRCGNTEFRWGERTYVMGICNLSPDSFSGDGLGADVEATLAQAQRMVAEGADIIDVGGNPRAPAPSRSLRTRLNKSCAWWYRPSSGWPPS